MVGPGAIAVAERGIHVFVQIGVDLAPVAIVTDRFAEGTEGK